MDPLDEISRSLQAHPSKAQILLEVEDEGNALDSVLEILKAHGVNPIEYEVIQKGVPSFFLFYLSTNDMREIILKLTEAGFNRLKALSSKQANLKNK